MKKTTLALFAGLLTSSLSTHAVSSAPPNKSNWNSHPEIKQVRAVVKNIQMEIARKQFRGKVKRFEYCEPYQDTVRILYTSKNKTPRKYYYEAGSGDSSLRWDLYYDRKGQLRFAYIRGGAANGTEIEHRIYLNAKGQRIWEFQKRLAGPGYTFPTKNWPEKEIGFDPGKQFDLANKCPAKK